MSNHVSMCYEMRSLDVDASKAFLDGIVNARDAIKGQYEDKVNVHARQSGYNHFDITIGAAERQDFDAAVRTFLDIAGNPTLVARGSSHDLVDGILRERGKMLVGKFNPLALVLDAIAPAARIRGGSGINGRKITDLRPYSLMERALQYVT